MLTINDKNAIRDATYYIRRELEKNSGDDEKIKEIEKNLANIIVICAKAKKR